MRQLEFGELTRAAIKLDLRLVTRSNRLINRLVMVDVTFKIGDSHLLVGPPASGKTYRIKRILELKESIFEHGDKVQNVIFCYARWQPAYQDIKDLNVVTKWVQGLPTNDEFIELTEPFKNYGGSICVLDDFMADIDKDMVEIVCVSARHQNTSIFLLFQSLFPPNPLARQISLNVKYIHVHKNPRENAQFQFLARQILPNDYKWLVAAQQAVTKEPHGCLLIDMTQSRDDSMRFRSHIFPEEFPIRCYVKK